ncbi:MAG TPA: helix-turn-helix transcriptional regulator [Spirochaetia bacterium]|nr:helix-turn-helix transcriptional regulator [Spirochaetales bacterium]HRY80089.1 helix-turn-helix transcriptional regulator [Spirochaetia bacterium]
MAETKTAINPLARIGRFTALVFVAGSLLMFVVWMSRGWGFVKTITHPYIGIQLLVALLFYISSRSPKLYIIQPILLLIQAPINFLDSHDSFYGLGFFVMAVLLLFKIGFFERGRIPKVIGLLVYLYGWELFAAIRAGRHTGLSLTPVFFVTVFLIFLYILYKEQVIVYLKQPKPLLDLQAKGLADTEAAYILALAKGLNVKEIAGKFEVSESTVRNTLARAYKKLGVQDKAELSTFLAEYTLPEG